MGTLLPVSTPAHPRFTINNSLKTYYPAQIQGYPQWPPTLSSQLLSLNLGLSFTIALGSVSERTGPTFVFPSVCSSWWDWVSRLHGIFFLMVSCNLFLLLQAKSAATRDSVQSTQHHGQTRMPGHRSKPHVRCFEDLSGGPLGCRTAVL